MSKGSFILYHDHEDFFSLLDADQTKELVSAIFAYEIRSIEPDLDGVTKMAFTAIRQDLDRNRKKWEKTKEARSRAGKASAKARKAKADQEAKAEEVEINTKEQNEHMFSLFNKSEQNEQKGTNATVNDNVNVNVNVNGKAKDKTIVHRQGDERNLKTKAKKANDELFESLWKLYPLKRGKGSVSDSKKAEIAKVGHDHMVRAIDRYKKDVESADFDLAYKNGSTFFNSGYVDYLDDNYTPRPTGRPKVRPRTVSNRHIGSEGPRDFSHLEE